MEHHASRRALVAVAAALLVVLTPALDGAWAASGKRSAPRRRPAPPPQLVWHAETLDGQAGAASEADRLEGN